MTATPRILLASLALGALAVAIASCGSRKAFQPRPRSKPVISHHEIYQPDTSHPGDEVILWKGSDRGERAFLLPPGTRVELVETVDTAEGKTMFRIKTDDDRTAWVPKSHCKAIYKK